MVDGATKLRPNSFSASCLALFSPPVVGDLRADVPRRLFGDVELRVVLRRVADFVEPVVEWSKSAALDVAMIREQRKSAAEDLCKNAEQIDAGKSKCGAFEKSPTSVALALALALFSLSLNSLSTPSRPCSPRAPEQLESTFRLRQKCPTRPRNPPGSKRSVGKPRSEFEISGLPARPPVTRGGQRELATSSLQRNSSSECPLRLSKPAIQHSKCTSFEPNHPAASSGSNRKLNRVDRRANIGCGSSLRHGSAADLWRARGALDAPLQ